MRQRLVLLQPRIGVDQPLQLARGIEGALVLCVKGLRGSQRHGLAQQDVGVRSQGGHGLQEGAVEHHECVGVGPPGNVVHQSRTGHRLDHDTVGLGGRSAGRPGYPVNVAVQPVQVDHQHRAVDLVRLQGLVEFFKVGRVRATLVAGFAGCYGHGGDCGGTPQHDGTAGCGHIRLQKGF